MKYHKNKTSYKKGNIPWNTGKGTSGSKGKHWKLTNESKKKMSIARMGKPRPLNAYSFPIGEKHPFWKGGNNHQTRKRHAPYKKPEQCEVCGAMENICFDHDHETGKFRGWICTRCNVALGMVKDNTETLMALAEYIKKSRIIK